MNQPIDSDAELASEVIRVMNDEKLGPKAVALATSVVMTKRQGFGEAGKIINMVKTLLDQNPQLLSHLHHNARPMNSADAHARWEQEMEAREIILQSNPQQLIALVYTD